jgi:hypothetical protein
MEEFINEIIESQVKLLIQQKEDLLKARLFNYLGYDVDIVAECKKRFPRLKMEQHSDKSEHYYWNLDAVDGQGHEILVIAPLTIDFSNNDTVLKTICTVGFKYK